MFFGHCSTSIALWGFGRSREEHLKRPAWSPSVPLGRATALGIAPVLSTAEAQVSINHYREHKRPRHWKPAKAIKPKAPRSSVAGKPSPGGLPALAWAWGGRGKVGSSREFGTAPFSKSPLVCTEDRMANYRKIKRKRYKEIAWAESPGKGWWMTCGAATAIRPHRKWVWNEKVWNFVEGKV